MKMLDLKNIRTNTDFVKERLGTRGIDPKEIDKLLDVDQKRRDLIVESETLKKTRNEVSDQISLLKRQKEDANDKITEMRKVSGEIKELDAQLQTLTDQVQDMAAHLPNIPNQDVPISLTEEGSVELRKVGKPREFTFKPKAHWDIGEDLGILDFERAAKVSGSRFVYYIGMGAKLERAVDRKSVV